MNLLKNMSHMTYQCKTSKHPISASILKAKALYFTKEFSYEDFQAPDGRLEVRQEQEKASHLFQESGIYF